MATKMKPGHRLVMVPPAPEPSAKDAAAGLAEGRELARRYWVDLVRLNASIALAPDAEVSLHTRMVAAKEIRELAVGVPPPVPEAPPPVPEAPQPDDA